MNIQELLDQVAEAKATLLMEIDELTALLKVKQEELEQLSGTGPQALPLQAIEPVTVRTSYVMPSLPTPDYIVCGSCDGRMEHMTQTLGNGKTYNALVCVECNNEKVA